MSVQNISNTNELLAILITNTFDCCVVKPDTFFKLIVTAGENVHQLGVKSLSTLKH